MLRHLLWLYPSEFRHAYGEEFADDLRALRREAARTGRATAVVALYAFIGLDLVRSVPRAWLRTPWLGVLAAAALVTGLEMLFIGERVWRFHSLGGGMHHEAPDPGASPAPRLMLAIGAAVFVASALVRAFATRIRVRSRRA